MMKKIAVTRSSMPPFEEYLDEIKDLWESGWLSNGGVKHQRFIELLKDYLHVENISLFANGHVALEVALQSLGLSGEVITPSFTHVSTTHSICRNGLTPVFCDINTEDFTIDVDQMETLITEDTCAIMPTHVYGNICDIYRIEQIAQKHNLKVIYDAAHAFGETIDGRGVLEFGDASMVSLHATKVFHTIEGGLVAYSDKKLFEAMDYIINFGFTGQESTDYIGTNARMNEFEAAMGICNIKYIDGEIAKRKQIVERYRKYLDGVAGIKMIKEKNNINYNYAYLPVFFDGYKADRNQVTEELAQHNVFARKYFYPITSDMECYASMSNKRDTPVSRYYSERVLSLPLYADMDVSDVDFVCNIILNMK